MTTQDITSGDKKNITTPHNKTWYSPAKWWRHTSNWFTLLLLCTSVPLVLCCYRSDRGARTGKAWTSWPGNRGLWRITLSANIHSYHYPETKMSFSSHFKMAPEIPIFLTRRFNFDTKLKTNYFSEQFFFFQETFFGIILGMEYFNTPSMLIYNI